MMTAAAGAGTATPPGVNNTITGIDEQLEVADHLQEPGIQHEMEAELRRRIVHFAYSPIRNWAFLDAQQPPIHNRVLGERRFTIVANYPVLAEDWRDEERDFEAERMERLNEILEAGTPLVDIRATAGDGAVKKMMEFELPQAPVRIPKRVDVAQNLVELSRLSGWGVGCPELLTGREAAFVTQIEKQIWRVPPGMDFENLPERDASGVFKPFYPHMTARHAVRFLYWRHEAVDRQLAQLGELAAADIKSLIEQMIGLSETGLAGATDWCLAIEAEIAAARTPGGKKGRTVLDAIEMRVYREIERRMPETALAVHDMAQQPTPKTGGENVRDMAEAFADAFYRRQSRQPPVSPAEVEKDASDAGDVSVNEMMTENVDIGEANAAGIQRLDARIAQMETNAQTLNETVNTMNQALQQLTQVVGQIAANMNSQPQAQGQASATNAPRGRGGKPDAKK